VLFVAFPRAGLPAEETFDAPLYVALEPVRPDDPEQAPPIVETAPQPEPEPERPVQEPEPVPNEDLAATAPVPPSQTTPSRDEPAPPNRAETAPPPSQTPTGTARSSSDSSGATVPPPREPTPPPPPPRERSFDPAGLEPTTTDRPDVRAEQLREIAEMQDEYLEALAEWESRQAELAAASSGDTDAAGPTDEAPPSRLNDFQDQLSALIDGIRSAENVVSTDGRRDTTSGDRAGPGSEEATDTSEPGSGSVTIEDAGGGTRRLLTDPTVDVSSVSLPGSFPPTYLAEVRFRVRPDGYVEWASLTRPTTVPELDRVLEETVRSWRFEPAAGSSRVEGSVTILIDTTD